MIDIGHFRVGIYRFLLRTMDSLFLPPYKGSTIRGGLGSVFKDIVCFQEKNKDCSSCLLHGSCPYYYIFETMTPPAPQIMSGNVSAPRPFVLEPPLEDKEKYTAGENISFNLILIGKAIEYLPYFIVVFDELGKKGIGLKRGQYELVGVDCIDKLAGTSRRIFSCESKKLVEDAGFIAGKDVKLHFNSDVNDLTLSFLTPTRIKHKGSFIKYPEMHILFRNLLRRLNLLSYFHHNEKVLIYDIEEIVGFVKNIQITENDIVWYDWHRFSKRQRNRMDFGGFMGKAKYSGPLGELLPILFLGSLIHIGKNTTFGLGKMVLELNESSSS